MTEHLSDRIDKLAGTASDMARRLERGAIDILACEAARKMAQQNYEGQKRNTLAFLREKTVLAEALQWIIDYGAPAEIEAKAREALKSVDLGEAAA